MGSQKIRKRVGHNLVTKQQQQSNEQKVKRMKKIEEPQRPLRYHRTHHSCIMEVPEEEWRKKEHKKYLKKHVKILALAKELELISKLKNRK